MAYNQFGQWEPDAYTAPRYGFRGSRQQSSYQVPPLQLSHGGGGQYDLSSMLQMLQMAGQGGQAAPAFAKGTIGAAFTNPYVAIPAVIAAAAGGHKLLMSSKRKAQKERRNIRSRAANERARETFAITDAYEGAARRAGQAVASRAAAAGMGGSGAAFRSVIDARLPLLSNIPGEVRAARAEITRKEEDDLAQVTDLGPALAGLAKSFIPMLGHVKLPGR